MSLKPIELYGEDLTPNNITPVLEMTVESDP